MEEFRRYYKEADLPWGELGAAEESHIISDPSHLIVVREGEQILGHAIWHESNAEKHTREGNLRNEDDRRVLRMLVGQGKEFVELHEIWLRTERRGKGYGKLIFDFFEDFIFRRGHDTIVYYADDPAALAICRERGYKEAYGVEAAGRPVYVLCLSLKERAAGRARSTSSFTRPSEAEASLSTQETRSAKPAFVFMHM